MTDRLTPGDPIQWAATNGLILRGTVLSDAPDHDEILRERFCLRTWSHSFPYHQPQEATVPTFRSYARKAKLSELTPWTPGFDLSKISVDEDDIALRGSPKTGDMIARNPLDHANQWLIERDYFAENFEPDPVDAA